MFICSSIRSVRGSGGSVHNSVRGSGGSVHNSVRGSVRNVRGSIPLLLHDGL
jgi:hypothetical protein